MIAVMSGREEKDAEHDNALIAQSRQSRRRGTEPPVHHPMKETTVNDPTIGRRRFLGTTATAALAS